MKSKILLILCLVLSFALVLASCEEAPADSGNNGGANPPAGNNGGTTDSCDHILSTDWTMNATHHWHATTCEHGENRGSYAEHADADENSKCDSCNYDMPHVCTYSDEWQSDAKNHWRMTACATHTKPSTLELHSDANSDAACDVCGAHVHVLTGNGMCLGCGEQIKVIDTSNLSGVIASLVDHRGNISGGKLTSNFIGRYNNSAQATKKNSIVDYLYGNGSAYYKVADAVEVKGTDREGTYYEASTTNLIEKWINREADDSVFAVYKETTAGVTGEIAIDAANADTLNGHYYSVSTLASGYGAEGILDALYKRSQETGSSDFTVEEGDGSYKFSFNYLAVNSVNTTDQATGESMIVNNVNYFVVSIEFTYTDNYELTSLSITCDCYTSDAGSNLAGDLDIDNIDLEFAAQTGKIELLEGAKADTYTFTVEQTVGARTFVNEYNKAYFAPKSTYDVYADADFTTLREDTVTISLTNLPEDETSPYVRFFLKESGEDGKPFSTADGISWTTSDNAGLTAVGFSTYTSQVRFLAKAVGTYTVTITVADATKTFTVVVVA